MRYSLGMPVLLMTVAFGVFGCELFSERTPSRVPQSEKKEPETIDLLQDAGLEVTPAEDYLFPLKEGGVGSAWCVCRNVGTSPHVGQDYVNSGEVNSVAVANGRVAKVEFLGGGCGWALILEDGLGARWRYLHLNKPKLTEGEIVAKGASIGVHQDYPTPACGTGPHLHLDRLVPGTLPPVAAAGRKCQNGFRSCNFNPVHPLVTKMRIAASTKKKSGAKKKNPTPSRKGTTPIAPPPPPRCSASQPAPVLLTEADEVPRARKISPEDSVIGLEPEVILDETPDEAGRHPFTLSSVTLIFSNGSTALNNVCDDEKAEGDRERCLIRWEMHAGDGKGAWWRIAASQDARNRPISIPEEKHFCLPAGASKVVRFVAYTESGRVLVNELTDETDPQ